MKTSRFAEEQIAFAVKQHELGTRVGDVCRKTDRSAMVPAYAGSAAL